MEVAAACNNDPNTRRDSQRSLDFCVSLTLALFCLLIYNANLRLINAGDTYPARYLPFGILRYGTVLLDPIAGVTLQGQTRHFWMIKGRNDHQISLYPVVLPLVITPLYLPAVAYLNRHGWTVQRLDNVSRLMEKLASSLIASLSSALMYLLLRRRVDVRSAILLTVAYAFGTNTWMIGSQALWQHGLGELLLVAGLFLLTGPCTAGRALALGVVCGLLPSNRPPDAIFAAALGLYGLRWATRRAPLVVAGAVAPGVLLLAYNFVAAGNVLGGYGLKGTPAFFDHRLLPGIAGLLFSFGKGLFVFSPFLLFLPFGLRWAFRDRDTRGLALLGCAAVVVQMLLYAKADWRAGSSWGPRWLTDMLPLLVWMLAPSVARMGRAQAATFVLAICASIAVQVVGAFWYTGKSNQAIMAINDGPGWMRASWDFRNTPFIVELQHPPAPRTLRLKIDGFIDSVKAGDREITEAPAGTKLVIEGWALVKNHTPRMAEIMLVPDKGTKWPRGVISPVWQTVDFKHRADVSSTMHTDDPAGWRVAVGTDGFEPGDYTIEEFAWDDTGDFRPVMLRPFKVLAKQSMGQQTIMPAEMRANTASPANVDLGDLAQRAAERIRAHQQPAGYWLTAYTQSTRFDNPKREMNTFLTSMLVDLLDPVASYASLDENLARARRHLSEQIEANGLVRYHGRPDSPTIPALGCVITPDADDTALAWRIGGGGKEALLPGVLEILKSYRTSEGLYRTWLAPRDEYVSIDPGHDPNPADIGIQMNVLMFLRGADATAARALCDALKGLTDEDRLWVYYQEAPLVPLLREADLRKAGTPVELPAGRTQTSVQGQQEWVNACKLLARYENGGEPKPAADETLALLDLLAAGDFSEIRNTPPLIYHNDLSAKARRFYWSEDFGYALWLRLYHETTGSRGAQPAP